MLSLILTLAAAAPLTPCAPDEVVVLSCPVKKKQLAVCAGPASAPTWLQYRFGPPGKPELVFPADKKGFSDFTFEQRVLARNTSNELTFSRSGTTYTVWSTDGFDGSAGVNVTQGKTVTPVSCTGDYTENWSVLEEALARTTRPPDPLAGKSPTQVCDDETLLLLTAPWDELITDGFAKRCCKPGVLDPDEMRCEVGWPTSEIMPCRDLDLMRNHIYAYYGYVFKEPTYRDHFAKQPWYTPRADFQMSWIPAQGQKNAARLKTLVETKDACLRDDELLPDGKE